MSYPPPLLITRLILILTFILPPVLKKPLGLFSRQPLTGYYRDGYCRTGPDDTGNHAIAATLTTAFLDFSASRGNNLRAVPGLDAGCKWCLCTARWKEALDAFESGEVKDRNVVPKVALHATDESALSKGVDLGTLKKWAAEGEAQGGGGALEKKEPLDPKVPGGIIRETH